MEAREAMSSIQREVRADVPETGRLRPLLAHALHERATQVEDAQPERFADMQEVAHREYPNADALMLWADIAAQLDGVAAILYEAYWELDRVELRIVEIAKRLHARTLAEARAEDPRIDEELVLYRWLAQVARLALTEAHQGTPPRRERPKPTSTLAPIITFAERASRTKKWRCQRHEYDRRGSP